MSRPTKWASHRGSPAPVAMADQVSSRWWLPIHVDRPVCSRRRQWSEAVVLVQGAWGRGWEVGVSIPDREHKAYGVNPRALALGSPVSIVSLPCSHHVGLPSQRQQSGGCDRVWLSVAFVVHPAWGCSLTFPVSLCVLLYVSFVKWPRKEHISAGVHSIWVDKSEFKLGYF